MLENNLNNIYHQYCYFLFLFFMQSFFRDACNEIANAMRQNLLLISSDHLISAMQKYGTLRFIQTVRR